MIGKAGIFFWINDICAGAEYGYRLPFPANCAAMGSGIYAASQTAEDDDAARGEIAGQPLGHADAVGSRMTGADHRSAGLREC